MHFIVLGGQDREGLQTHLFQQYIHLYISLYKKKIYCFYLLAWISNHRYWKQPGVFKSTLRLIQMTYIKLRKKLLNRSGWEVGQRGVRSCGTGPLSPFYTLLFAPPSYSRSQAKPGAQVKPKHQVLYTQTWLCSGYSSSPGSRGEDSSGKPRSLRLQEAPWGDPPTAAGREP